MSSPIMMLWLDLRVRTSIACTPFAWGRRTGPLQRLPLGTRRNRDRTFVGSTPARRRSALARFARLRARSWHADRCDPQLNQIRTWVRQGRTDAWIAHQLEVTVQQIEAFKRENDLAPDETATARRPGDFDDEIDLRAEDDALIAAELEAAEAEAEPRRRPTRRTTRTTTRTATTTRTSAAARAAVAAAAAVAGAAARAAARSRAPSTTARRATGCGSTPPSQDDPVYAEHWAGHRPVEVTIEEDQIVIRRAGDDD